MNSPSQKPKRDYFKPTLVFNIGLIFLLAAALIFHYFKIIKIGESIFIILSFLGLIPVAVSAVKALVKRRLTIDLLASIALIFAFIAREWYSAVFINLMLSFARIFDIWTAMRAKNIIEHLLKYRPDKVKIKKGDAILTVPLEKLAVGDQVVVDAGDRVPIDGRVLAGQASLNEAILTGESEPITKKAGDPVWSSTLNEAGSLIVLAEKIGKDTTLAKIILLVEEASRKKAKTEKLADKFTQWYIIATLFGSMVLYLIIRDPNLLLAILLVVCADDIAVAIPLSYTAAIAKAAERGIIIKGSDVVEKLSKITYFVADKTGTLTHGKPKIRGVKTFADMPHEKFLELIGTAEISSKHPVGVAIVDYVKNSGAKIFAPDECVEAPGEGISCTQGGRKLISGKIKFLEKSGIVISAEEQKLMDEEKEKGFGIVALGAAEKLLGFVALEDAVRPFARSLVRDTKKLGVKKWTMLTGDNEKVAARVAGELGIDQFEANFRPEDKLKYLENLKTKTRGTLAMIGDGVNDAAALALADVSFAMGVIGSDTAIEAADVALMNDKLERVPEAILIGKKTVRIIKQNFLIWGLTNAGGLLLVLLGVLGPVGAATFNFVTDFFPIMNSLKINFFYSRMIKKG